MNLERLSPSERKALTYILLNGPVKGYDLLNAPKLGLNTNTAYAAPKGLVKKGLLEAEKKGKTRAGLPIWEYRATFRGLAKYLIALFKAPPPIPEEADAKALRRRVEEDKRWLKVKRAVNSFNQYDDYPLFKELETLEKWFGEERGFYECLMALACWLKDTPPHIFVEMQYGSGDLASLLKSPRKPIVSEAWIYGFTYLFFRYAYAWRKETTEGSFLNPTLHRLAQETLEKESQHLKQELETLNKLKRAYAVIFKEE